MNSPSFEIKSSFLLLSLFLLAGFVHASEGTIYEDLQKLDHALQSRLRQLEHSGETQRPETRTLFRDAERFHRSLEHLETQALDDAARNKIRGLLSLVRNLERAGVHHPLLGLLPAEALARSQDAQPIRSKLPAGPPPNDACTQATLISEGTYLVETTLATSDGSASCGSSLSGKDVWFKYVVSRNDRIFASTLGSDFDTVLSVHEDCPGTTVNQISCNDDLFGLQSSLDLRSNAGEEVWIRVSGFDQASGSAVLNVGTGGELQGTVTDKTTNQAVEGVRVESFNVNGYFEGSSHSDPEGAYSIPGRKPGTYFIGVDHPESFLSELHQGIICPSGVDRNFGCSPSMGTPILLDVNGLETIDFALTPSSSITGTITDSLNQPVTAATVSAWGTDGNVAARATSDEIGSYVINGLAAGSYFISVESSLAVDELYPDVPCPGGPVYGCDPTAGTPVPVAPESTTPSIDLSLDFLGTVSGTVKTRLTGTPLQFVLVEFFKIEEGTARYAGVGFTNSSGDYWIGGLASGVYVAKTISNSYSSQLYENLLCEDCDVTQGTPLLVDLNRNLTDVDFDLQAYGKILGTVTESGTQTPLSNVQVDAWDLDGNWIKSDSTNNQGGFELEELRPGNYFISAKTSSHVDRVYPDINCPSTGCAPTLGTPLAVMLDQTLLGIDLELPTGGSISGQVIEASTGEALSGSVTLWNEAGEEIVDSHINGSGQYTFLGLPTGSYYVTTGVYDSRILNEVYQDFPCPRESCTPTDGTPISVAINDVFEINFALRELGRISGTLTNTVTNLPIPYYRVYLYSADGQPLRTSTSNASGLYTFSDLLEGTYYVITGESDSFIDESYDDLPCLNYRRCDPTKGTPIRVSHGSTTSSIDFALAPKHGISGQIVDNLTGLPLQEISVHLWSDNGVLLSSRTTSESGHYAFDGPGRFFVSTNADYPWINQIYGGVECPEGSAGDGFCDPATGTLIEVSEELGSVAAGIDFRLSSQLLYEDDFESGTLSTWIVTD